MQPVWSSEQREMPRSGVSGNLIARPAAPFLARFVGKFVLDIMPAALASVIGGFLFTQYQFGHTSPKPQLEAVTPASAEMLAMVRDEHAVIIDYLKAQTAAEKNKLAAVAEPADTREASAANSDAGSKPAAKPADLRVALDASAHRAAVVLPRPAPVLAKAAIASPPQPPLVIAQADQPAAQADAQPDRLARDPNSLLGKTLDLKDHVVAATTNVVSAIGVVFTSVGEHIGSVVTGGRQFASDS
jgi:hypothetical protein